MSQLRLVLLSALISTRIACQPVTLLTEGGFPSLQSCHFWITHHTGSPAHDEACLAVFQLLDADSDGSVTYLEIERAISGDPPGPMTPFGIHIGVGERSDAMMVGWSTKKSTAATLTYSQDGDEEVTVAATTSNYSVPERWWPTNNPNWVHVAKIPGLRPGSGSTISYRVSSDGLLHSSIFTFKAPPASGQPTKVACFGDMGTVMPLGFAVAKAVAAEKENLDLVVHFGDISYAGIDTSFPHLNISKDDEIEPIWDLFQIQNEAFAATVPYHTAIGNHDLFYSAKAFLGRYAPVLPCTGEGETPFWYSFDHGLVRWIQLSSEHEYGNDSAQGKWLAKTLANVDRMATPWVVVTIHRPPFCSEGGWPENWSLEQVNDLIPLFLENEVDLVLSGHMHAFERTHAVGANGTVVTMPSRTINGDDVYISPDGPIYVTQGNAGAMQSGTFPLQKNLPEWSAVRMAEGRVFSGNGSGFSGTFTDTFGFGVASFMNSTHMYYSTRMITGTLHDAFWVVKSARAG